MIKKFKKIYNHLGSKKSNEHLGSELIPNKIVEVKEKLNKAFENCSDFVLREIALDKDVRIIVAFIDGLVNNQNVNESIIRPLILYKGEDKCSIKFIKESILNICQAKEVNDFNNTLDSILSGDTIIYVDGQDSAIKCDARGWEARSVQQPDTESVIRGPRDAFTETLSTNVALIRRRIKSTKLKFESMKIGRESKTDVCIAYIEGIADEDIISTLRRRLSNIDVDAVLDSGMIEQLIEDGPSSIFPTVGSSERPDRVASRLLEGRVAIICDGSPFVVTVPYLFIESIHVSEDYYSKPYFMSYTRAIRFLALLTTTLLPALYVAVSSFHVNIIPLELLLSMASAAEGIPFSPFIESIAMMVVFEILREAGIRMPRPVGQAVSIVGALVIGESAVAAGLVSSSMVIIVSLTAISSFVVPSMNEVVTLLRIVCLIAANILGLLGVFFVLMVVVLHLVSLRSFGVPYLYPFSPLNIMDMKDAIIRAPLWMMISRPLIFNHKNVQRMKIKAMKKED
ncbi:spore germination protein [Alkalithermobacter paradoxus]|uniref:Spore germination protein B1 n=1 Tax=Alkalithermobacter paradoxus TaxID=29349 RepID=A0A1V4I663_9FIRM|nr:spore germination protein B1 [[Clostridium] thermoalcaliphilum]